MLFWFDNMQHLHDGQLEWLEFELLADIPSIRHGVFLRQGGYSQGVFASLNASYLVGDQIEHVTANLQMIETHLHKQLPNLKKIVYARNCHDTFIELIHANSPTEILNCDGLMTSTATLPLIMKHADCQIVIFYDPIHHAVATIHAGWRGNVKNIFEHTLNKMKSQFGTNPADLLVCISPSLGPEEAEFIHYKVEMPEDFWQFQVRPTYFDLWSISEYQLQNLGILPHHIEIARLSTYSNPHDYFSYRRDKITGRHATYVALLT